MNVRIDHYLKCKMEHLAYCEAKAKELERIIIGEKSMLIRGNWSCVWCWFRCRYWCDYWWI